MNLSELLRKGLVRTIEPSKDSAKDLLLASERDLKAASDNLRDGNHEWALAISYNSMLSAGRALMASMGYSPSVDAHHLAVVQFCGAVLPPGSEPLVSFFNRYRVRRHDVIYGEAGSVGPEEAKTALENANLFIVAIRKRV